MRRFISISLLVMAYVLFSSHELFLKTDNYFMQPNSSAELYLFNGTFDKSENVITRDRISKAMIVGSEYERNIPDSAYYDKDNSTYLEFETGLSSTYTAGISTLPKMIELDANAFNNYLEHEGLVDTIEERQKEGSSKSGVREKYSKHVKNLFQVGDVRTQAYGVIFNFPIEFIPMTNPYDATVGDSLRFKLLRNGKPLPNHIVHFSTSSPGIDAHDNENSTRTNEAGIMSMTPTSAGNWYIATIHMEKSGQKDVDYESNWATLTFGVR